MAFLLGSSCYLIINLGALFTFHHLRRETLTCAPESKGITLSCPLDRIIDLQPSQNHDFTYLVSLVVQLPTSDFRLENETESILSSQTIEIGPLQHVSLWSCLQDIVYEAKQRPAPTNPPPIMVDFGPYNFFQNDIVPLTPSSNISLRDEKAIRLALGFSGETELWSKHLATDLVPHRLPLLIYSSTVTRARLYRTITSSGFFVVSQRHLGFWSKNITQRDLRYRLPTSLIKYAEGFNLGWLSIEGVTLGIKGRPEVKFVFKSAAARDQAIDQISIAMKAGPKSILSPQSTFVSSPLSSPPLSPKLGPSPAPQKQVSRSTLKCGTNERDVVDVFSPLSRSSAAAAAAAADLPFVLQKRLPKVINIPRELLVTKKSLHFVCLTIGSRGDIQPYIALGLELMNLGHRVTIVTHEEYRDWIVGFGLSHRSAGGDPGALMKLSVDHKVSMLLQSSLFFFFLTHFHLTDFFCRLFPRKFSICEYYFGFC